MPLDISVGAFTQIISLFFYANPESPAKLFSFMVCCQILPLLGPKWAISVPMLKLVAKEYFEEDH